MRNKLLFAVGQRYVRSRIFHNVFDCYAQLLVAVFAEVLVQYWIVVLVANWIHNVLAAGITHDSYHIFTISLKVSGQLFAQIVVVFQIDVESFFTPLIGVILTANGAEGAP
ncbi:MAG TPA: hypothetical protein VMW69_07355 [Spirochaetia bacterium]|nr:hypothetical protein [Spirochaetia bacterium]